MSNKKNIIEELKRYNEINKYLKTLITEQEVPNPDEPVTPPVPDGTEVPDPAVSTDTIPTPDMGTENTTEPTPEIPEDTTADDSTEELDITDLVNMTKSIKKDLETKNNNGDTAQKMDDIFSKLSELEQKLNGMNELVSKIDNLSNEIQEVKPKTPVEKLEMRSLDSYPFNEKPQEFFDQKTQEMKRAGKNEYVLTKDDIENYGKNEIMKTFNPDEEEENQYKY